MPIDSRQYDSAVDFTFDAEGRFSKLLGNIVDDDDKVRLKAYAIWESMYANWPEDIRITLRGDDEDSVQIYMPSAKKNIEAVNRYLAVNWRVTPNPLFPQQDTNKLKAVGAFMDQLFTRERLKSKFAQMKRYMLVKGDALLHVRADPNKSKGKRISIDELKPEHYFPIENGDGDRIGCHIVDVVPNPKTSLRLRYYNANEVVRRQTYRREIDKRGYPTGRITSELALYEIGKWDDRIMEEKDLRLIEQIRDEYYLPPAITAIPVYHWRNNAPPMSTFGISELSGVESLVNAINQSMSDEDLTLIMQGLGVYWTDAAPPLNSAGEEVEWEISPRSVVQVASGGQFGRVSGISTIQPFGDHITALENAIQGALGVPDIAVGEVDATVAESGIARYLKLHPLVVKNQEKELEILDVADQFIHDLIEGWFVAYERLDTVGISFVNLFDNAMPKDKSKDLADLTQLWAVGSGVLPIRIFYQQLNEIMGWDLDPSGDFQQALGEAQQIAEASAPPPPPMPPGGDPNNSGANSGSG